MQIDKNTTITINMDSKPSSIAFRDSTFQIGTTDGNIFIRFDTKENMQFFLNMVLMACNQRVIKADKGSEYERAAYVYDYEPLNNPDIVQLLWEAVENASDVTL